MLKRFVISMFLVLVLAVSQANAQNWSGVLDTSRAIDWSSKGVSGGIPTSSTACSTVAPYTGTAGTINTAISGCSGGTLANPKVVLLSPAGTYTLSTCIVTTTSNVVLRGLGADQTKLKITGHCGGDFLAASLMVWGGENNCCPGGGGTIQHSGTWTAGYAKGTTVVTLGSTTGLSVGNIIILDQLDDAVDGWPAAGDIIVSTSSASPRFTSEGGGNVVRASRANAEVATVTNINGLNVTIDTPIELPNYRSGQTPGAWWGNTTVSGVGIESLSVDSIGNGGNDGIGFYNALNCWVKGVRSLAPANGLTEHYNIRMVVAARITIRDSYIYGPASQANTNYGISPWLVSDLLTENNILDAQQSAVVDNAPNTGSVFGYNYAVNTVSGAAPTHVPHEGGEAMDLYEGNDWTGVRYDIIHGTHQFFTTFRNFFSGGVLGEAPAHLSSFNRFMNFVGNVLGSASYTTYQTSGAPTGVEIYDFGDPCSGCSGGTVAADARVLATSLRWANYDTKTAANRFCGNSSDTGWSTTCASTSEIPTGITNFSNAVPTLGDTVAGQSALPTSFYLSAKPAWFGSVTWPPIGPDVSGGSIAGYAGHVYKIPSRVCYEGLSNDGAYALSPSVKTFNASTCYASVAPTTAPAAVMFTGLMQSSGGFKVQ
jgi:hypothetical protein